MTQGLMAFRRIDRACSVHHEHGIWRLCDPQNTPYAFVALPHLPLSALRAQVLEHARNKRYSLHVFVTGNDHAAIIEDMTQHGFVFGSEHFLIGHDLHVPDTPDQVQAQRVETLEQARLVQVAAGQKMVSEQDLPPHARGVRLHAVFEHGRAIAWVRSAQDREGWSWNDDLFTVPKARGRGVAASLMRHLHRDDVHWSVRATVSFSTAQNFEYHRKHGYVRLASKLRFVPKRSALERIWQRVARS
jgi:GNAT superfamily N-acetyltransferase